MLVKRKLITEAHIDFNQHVSENAFYSIAIECFQETLNGHGILKLFFEVNVAPIIFNTEIQFKREIFIGEYVELHMDILPSSPDMRKFQRTIKFFSADSSEAVAVVSNGAFFDLKKRRVTSPPNAVVMSFIRSGLVSKSAD
jgi:acyl-CoA thioester hydrolase